MTRMNFLTCALFMLSTGFASCSDNDYKEASPDPNVTVSSSPGSLSVGYEETQATISVSASREWMAYSEDSWITLEGDYLNPTTGEISTVETSATITLNIEANTGEERVGTVVLKAGTNRTYVTVTQEAAPYQDITCPLDGYTLVWNDEFDSGSVPGDDWTHEVWGPYTVNNELQYYVDGATPAGSRVTEVSDGTLKINCLKESGNVYSARLYAKVKEGWKYGYIEASIKLPGGKGTWPAFWMMPVNYTSWPDDGEIDIMEEVGYNPNYCVSTIHCNKYNNGGTSVESATNYIATAESEFHTYALEWTADYMTFYHDNVAVLTYSNDGMGNDAWPFGNPFYVILNVAWGGSWGGAMGVDESVLPATMEVDYVRVFQKE